ncbi:hypothetical protein CY34DRAFT_811889 [Suillus luteus UH-Slu-Lm8-n1]|uniref:Unplaced genomic scaffold CY34scaffold_458, whole genome shotgun sequence n=1 Tax=Suillus luteus UH-Slu-Lm8-n1 TaxID=930992 RepID=A0A0D0ACF9_9AGAM|nr:hypothetical protein CY34DRAFT_811889 [Suillus luteus UH-Slu-Lm8-n1]
MQRRKVNQSTLFAKAQVASLTIEFRLYPGAQSQSSSSATPVPYTTIVHHNPINSSLITLLQRHDHPKPKKEHRCPDWATSLLYPHQDDPEGFSVPLLPAQMDLARIPYYPVQTGPSYYKLARARRQNYEKTKAGGMAITGLIGDYGIESDSASEKAAANQTRDELGA